MISFWYSSDCRRRTSSYTNVCTNVSLQHGDKGIAPRKTYVVSRLDAVDGSDDELVGLAVEVLALLVDDVQESDQSSSVLS